MFKGVNSLELEQGCLAILLQCYPEHTIYFDYNGKINKDTESGTVDFMMGDIAYRVKFRMNFDDDNVIVIKGKEAFVIPTTHSMDSIQTVN